jgi:hypothetical protein
LKHRILQRERVGRERKREREKERERERKLKEIKNKPSVDLLKSFPFQKKLIEEY